MGNRSWFLVSTALVQAVVVTGLPAIALAQERLDDSSAPAQERSEAVIEEIIVTATRREAELQSVPLSVAVVTAEDLEQLGATGFADYARTVPGLSLTDQGYGGEKHTIRGINLNANFPEINPLTALYLDEVPIIGSGVLANYHADPMLVDIERIEILRGPQGTLFGASAMAGAIRIITRKPDVSRMEGFVDTAVSTTKGAGQGYETHGMLNMPFLNGQAAIRAVGYLRDLDGFIDNVATGDENVNTNDVVGGRLSATYRFDDRASVTGRISYQQRQSDGTNFEDVALPPRQQRHLAESTEDEWTNYNLVVNADLGWGTLMSSTSYLDRSLDATLDISPFVDAAFGFSNPLMTNIPDDVSELIQEFRLASKADGHLLWVLGAFYQDMDQDLFQDMPAPGFDAQTDGLAASAGFPDNLFVGRYNYTLEQSAFYGDVSYSVTDRLEVGAGARWFDIDRDYSADTRGLFAADPLASGAAHETGLMPRFSVRYDATDTITVYASAAEGFRSGGVNTTEGSNLPECLDELAAEGYSAYPVGYASDSLWSYELGAKTRWRNGRMQLNTAVYHIDWSDMQTTKFLDCGVFFVVNAGNVDSDGVELDLAMYPTDALAVNLAVNYNEAELRDDVPGIGGHAGNRTPGAPRFTGSLGVSYDFPAFGREGFIHANYQYVGKSYNVFDPAIRRELPSYDLTSLQAGVDGGRWKVTLFVNNLFDERGVVGLEDSVIRQTVTTTWPRTIGIGARWSF